MSRSHVESLWRLLEASGCRPPRTEAVKANLGRTVLLCSVILSLFAGCQKNEAKKHPRTRPDNGKQMLPAAGEETLSLQNSQESKGGPVLYQPPIEYVEGDCELKLSALPARGDSAHITFSVISKQDVPLMRVSFHLKGVELVSGDLQQIQAGLFKTYTGTEAGMKADVAICVRFVEDHVHVGATAVKILNKTDPTAPGHEVIRAIGSRGFRYYYDEEVAQYVTWAEFTSKPWWRFDPLTGSVGDLVSSSVMERNQTWIRQAREMKADISAWEALFLLYDVVNTSYPPEEAGVPVHEIATRRLTEGWVEEFRETHGRSLLKKFPDLQLPPEYQQKK